MDTNLVVCFYIYSIRKTYTIASYVKCTFNWLGCIMKLTKGTGRYLPKLYCPVYH